MTLRRMLAVATVLTALYCFLTPLGAAATVNPTTPPNIVYVAAGTFASTPASGADTLKLAGEPFKVSITVSAATPPTKTGPNYAVYTGLTLVGVVHSGLVGTTPVQIKSPAASIEQAINPGVADLFTMAAPVKVTAISLTIKANITMPSGTITKPLLHPFSAVTLSPTNATVTYSDGTNSTTLGVATGSLSATVKAAAAVSPHVILSSTGAEATVAHADGTQSVHSLSAGPIEAGILTDAINVKFYAIGVRDASEVHVRIGGEEVPVVYAGPSGYYGGLDEVIVQIPHSLAGRGVSDVVLTADGEASAPTHIHIQ